MPVQNAEIADLLDQLADLLEIDAQNPFRVRAYRNASRAVRGFGRPLAAMVTRGETLRAIPGVGEHIAEKIVEIVTTGKLAALAELEKKCPAGLADLLQLAGLGPRRVRLLHDVLGIHSLDGLEKALDAGSLAGLPGIGPRTEQKIRASLEGRATLHVERVLWSDAESAAGSLLEFLRAIPTVERAEVAGSFRRGQETIGDLDLLAASASGREVTRRFVEHEDVAEVLSRGTTRASVRLRSGLQVDLRVVQKRSFGAAWHYLTGSKAHNIAVRKRGVENGLKINEYGVFRGPRRIGGASEEQVYAAVDLAYVEPELREDRGEIEAAGGGRLPELVALEKIRGDLHVHTDATDGRDTLADMARAAEVRGYEYVAITDHTRNARVAGGLDARAMRAHLKRIDALRSEFHGLRILAGAEVDVLRDGSLDLDDDLLADLDLVVCAVHDQLELPSTKQTERLLRAMDHRRCQILAHPTGRLLGERSPSALDFERVLLHAQARGVVLELNGQPTRLDLSDVHCRAARDAGVRIVISSDAHSVLELDFMRHGVRQARRGWLGPADVLNARAWKDARALLRRD